MFTFKIYIYILRKCKRWVFDDTKELLFGVLGVNKVLWLCFFSKESLYFGDISWNNYAWDAAIPTLPSKTQWGWGTRGINKITLTLSSQILKLGNPHMGIHYIVFFRFLCVWNFTSGNTHSSLFSAFLLLWCFPCAKALSKLHWKTMAFLFFISSGCPRIFAPR